MSSSHRSKVLPFTAGLLVLILGLAAPSLAQAGKPVAATAPVDDRILVSIVDIPNQQITVTYQRDKITHVYVIDAATTVKAMGNPGTIKDIKAGQQVYNYAERDDKTLDSIEVGDAQPGPAVPTKGAGKKKNG